jgi:hypothetical protein
MKKQEFTKRQAKKDYKQAIKMNREVDAMVAGGEVESYQEASEIIACLEKIENDKSLSEKTKQVARNALSIAFEGYMLSCAAIMASTSVDNLQGENPITASHPEVAGIAGFMITAGFLGSAAITEYMRRDSNSDDSKRDLERAQWSADYDRKLKATRTS